MTTLTPSRVPHVPLTRRVGRRLRRATITVDPVERFTRAVLWVIIPVTSVAPALGQVGTAARLAIAVTAAALIILRPARVRGHVIFLTATLVALLAAMAVGAPTLTYGATRFVNWVMFIPLLFIGGEPERFLIVARSVIVAAWTQMVGVTAQLVGLYGGTWGGLLTSGRVADAAEMNWLTRYTGFAGNPNDLGLTLSIAAVGCVIAATVGMTRRRLFAFTSAAVFLWGVVLTGSRGAFVGVILGVAVATLFLTVRQRVTILTVGGIAGTVALTVEESATIIIDSLADIATGDDMSAGLRADLWGRYFTTSDNPLLGSGFGGYTRALITESTSGLDVAGSIHRSATVDNAWLKLFLEGGAVSVTVLAVLLAAVTIPLLSYRAGTGPDRSRAAILTVTLTMLVWRSMTADVFDINPWNAVLWVVAGLAAGLAHQAGPEGKYTRTG